MGKTALIVVSTHDSIETVPVLYRFIRKCLVVDNMAIKGISTKDILMFGAGIVVGGIALSLLKGFDFNLGYGLGSGDKVSYHSELADVRSNIAELGYGRQSSAGGYNSFTLSGE